MHLAFRPFPRILYRTIRMSATTNNAALNGSETIGQTKSAAKKAEKLAQRAAQKATKTPIATPGPSTSKKESKAKPVQEVQEDDWKEETPPGHKKYLSKEMAKTYDPIKVESAWYSWWQSQGYFEPSLTKDGNVKPAGSFVVAMPPPNITGALHTGHAMMLALEDTMARWQRMLGKSVLYCPGFDHASIATQSVVEKRLFRATGQTRHDLGREALLEKIWEWKEEYQSKITTQIQRIGVSCDWSRTAFTMSPTLSTAVNELFVRLHEEGTLYRANRLVNFCVFLNTTLSSIEVDQLEVTGRKLLNVPGYGDERIEFGVITSFSYPLEGTDEKITVATTRPETMLGDTAIAVHPDDDRYKHLHGKYAVHPFITGRRLIIIADDTVEKDFGTGAVKITPAHDPDDYRRGLQHKLEFINILNDDGTLNANAGPEFQGVKRLSARRKVVDRLKEIGLYVEAKDNPMNIPICSRSGDVVEPILKPQWWVNCKAMAEDAVQRTRSGELLIRPQHCEDEWYRWLGNIQDWCVSRQLWWGHRCPVYYVDIAGEPDHREDNAYWVSGRNKEEAEAKAATSFAGRKYTLHQDEDVLDTWFSSGLWPFSIMGWPEQTQDMRNFYPNSVLETGWDILFFWVARMVMLGLKLTGQMPFKEVFCHPLVRDAHGRKMSKSLGNVIDPIDVVQGLSLTALQDQLVLGNMDPKEMTKAKESQKKDFPKGIPQCGADALRFTLCAYTYTSRDVNLEINRIESYRHFCNKLWNATRFALLKLEGDFAPRPQVQRSGTETLVERWILDRLNFAAAQVNKNLEARNFMAATSVAYSFWLYELCDVYIEAMKPMTDQSADPQTTLSAQNTLYTCLDEGLRILAPFMPFVTEELWQRLPRRPQDSTESIMVASFPVHREDMVDAQAVADFDSTFDVSKAIRSMAGLYNLTSGLHSYVLATDAHQQKVLASQTATISSLVKGSASVTVVHKIEDVPAGCVSQVVSSSISVYLSIKGLVDVDAEVSKSRKKQDFARLTLEKLQQQIKVADYQTKTPQAVQERNTEKAADLEAEITALQAGINKLTSM